MSICYEVDINDSGRVYPHYWELAVGSCHAATLLRADVQEHLRKAKKDIGFRYLRCHGLLDDDMSVVIAPMIPGMGEPQISYFNIDRMIDFLLEINMKPFLELGFMPEAYASTPQTTFHYKGYSSMPQKDEQWFQLIEKLILHLEERYGAAEVREWFFEVWNEPNLRFFFDGTMEDYFHLYEMAARAIKGVDDKLRVGGPATSNNMWIPEFRAFCESNDVPYDFITTHHYPSDDPLSRAGMNGSGFKGSGLTAFEGLAQLSEEERMAKIQEFLAGMQVENKNPRDVLAITARKVKEEAGDYPVYYTEWNVGHYDVSYAAAGITATLAYNEGLVEGYSYWCVSDIFEEMGLHGLPYNNEFGLVNVYGIPKPSYRLFQALHEAGDRRLNVESEAPGRTAEVLALADDKRVMLFVYNHDIEERDIKPEEITLQIKGSVKAVQRAVIDRTHTAPYRAWEQMGKPTYPDRKQLLELEAASELVYTDQGITGTDPILALTADVESVTIFKIVRE